jgi:hypothetical protein
MSAILSPLLVDAEDPPRLQDFWAAALGVTEQQRWLTFRAEDRPKTVKNRLHLDVHSSDYRRLVALGARVLAHLPEWTVLADFEGNEFCAFPAPEAADEPIARVFAVCTDSARPEELAAWWAPLVGAHLGSGPDGTPRWLSGAAGWDGVIWKFVRVADTRVVPNRWRPTVTADPDVFSAAGAQPTDPGHWIDPHGNEFQLTAG